MTAGAVRDVRHVTLFGMAVNILLAGCKGVVGFLAGSRALVADAVHSLSDLVTDLAVVFGVKFWSAPADEDHPYGHGKIQALVTLFVGVVLLFVGCELGINAVGALFEPPASAPGWLAFAAAAMSVVSKEILFWQTRAVAKRLKSPALLANAWHHRSDALSSLPVMAAVVVAHVFPGLLWVDAVGAMVVSAFVARVAWQIVRPAIAELVDSGVKEKSAEVVGVALRVPGVGAVHKVRTRRSGGSFQADLHIQVDPDMTVAEGHAIGHAVQDAIVAAGIDVSESLVHVEPLPGPETSQVPGTTGPTGPATPKLSDFRTTHRPVNMV